MQSVLKQVASIGCLVSCATAPTFAQGFNATAAATPAPVAYVFVQTHQGVDVFDANTAGQLTLVSGSPFATAGQMGGINGKYLISVGTDYLHTYPVESNGSLGKQTSEINTQSYGGSQCGTTDNAGVMLDRTGNYFYVQLYGATYTSGGDTYVLCSDWQSYKLSMAGQFTFLGDLQNEAGYHGNAFTEPISAISSSDKFAYGAYDDVYAMDWAPFAITSTGELGTNSSFKQVGPTPEPTTSGDPNNYFPLDMTADTNNHLAILMYEAFAQNPPPPQLASFVINAKGQITSTNTWQNMPTPAITNIENISMSTSGKLLAVYGNPGLQIFHFNASSPITPYTSVLLPNASINQVAWDNNNHLYALSYASGELYVYTVTPTSVTPVSGSPFKAANAYGLNGLVVVPK